MVITILAYIQLVFDVLWVYNCDRAFFRGRDLYMTTLLSISIALAAGLLMTRVFKLLKLNFPDVTAYLIAGLFIGPYGLGRLGIPGLGFDSYENVEKFSILTNAALGFIAFAIGNEFRLSNLRSTGRQTVVIGVVQAITATLFVDLALVGLYFLLDGQISIPVIITLGAIATATAPAATLMVVRQYKAKGKVTDLLLPVVALDDAVGLIVFAVCFGVARAMQSGQIDIISIVFNPLIEIVLSLVLGAVLGAVLSWLQKLFYSNTNRLSLAIVFVLMTVALSMLKFQIGVVTVSFSTLLVCMMLGTTFCNLCPLSEDLMEKSDRWTAPLFTLFFVLSGAELELSVFADIAVIGVGVVYILARSAGKYFGSYFSAGLVGCDSTTKKYLGITLLPQAGVALGMCSAASALGEYNGALIRNIVLFGVLIYELFGPMLTKWALTKSGDIKPLSAEEASKKLLDLPSLATPVTEKQ